ncbi:HupE/UreJ family protein [Litorivivens sp.]|uniref:HupE/UreJ family protein n=1 Tax=Litorivivens sp. TaxID=2020868 RepID=UPI00356720D6
MLSPAKLTGTLLILLLLALHPLLALSHETGVATLTFDLNDHDNPKLSVELDVIDLELALGLDADADGSILWYEYQAKIPAIAGYINSALKIAVDGQPCTLQRNPEAGGVKAGVAPSIITEFGVDCFSPVDTLTVSNQLLSQVDSDATTLLVIIGTGAEKSLVLGRGETVVEIADTGLLASSVSYVFSGIHHILIGVDHLLFVLLLLLPAARSGDIRSRMIAVLGIVTAFTLAHSITLALSATGYLRPPAQTVEVVIAATVVMAALLNLFKPRHRASWIVAYCFGLIHGFGFANVLADITVSGNLRVVNLAAFNIGVELGQLAFVLLVFPLLCLLSARAVYSRYVVTSVSLCIALLGSVWMVERVG